MKYAASYHNTETLDTSGTTTYSEWFDISWANELYVLVDSTETGTPNSESIAVTLERTSGFRTDVPVEVLAFSAITGDTTEELYSRYHYDGGATAADNQMGMRVRFKYVTSGTWSVTNVKVYSTIYAKRA